MNDFFICHISPFTQLLNVESRFLIERMCTFTIKNLIHSCSRMRLFIEMYTSLNIKENNWDFVMMSELKKYYIGFLSKSTNFVANT